ncbi:MAG TPA: 50S ribosomal protein L6 [Cyclobacteriaceae bacterium]|jgi:large subunit ribosomal protein L6
MSRIGNKIIEIPKDVTIEVKEGNISVKGPKGSLSLEMDSDFKLNQEEGSATLKRPTEQKRHKALHGLYRSLINNMVVGVTNGYKKELEVIGVGYKAAVQGKVLELSLGYSHNIYFGIPEDLKISAETVKGKNPTITIEGIDKQLVGQVAAKIKSLRKVEPYKGKGIRFVGEYVRRKAGKTAAK